MGFPLRDDEIIAATGYRIRGKYHKTLKIITNKINFTELEPENFTTSDDPKRLAFTAREFVRANHGLARYSMDAPAAAHHLGEAKKGIDSVYKNPYVQSALVDIKDDMKGNPAELQNDFALDEVAYTITLSALTGNTSLFKDTVRLLNHIEEYTQKAIEIPLVKFRKDHLIYRSEKTDDNFKRLSNSYRRAIRNSKALSRWATTATIASRYAAEAIRRGSIDEALLGFKDFSKAFLKDRTVLGILKKEASVVFSEEKRHRKWRKTTPPGTDYSKLRLE